MTTSTDVAAAARRVQGRVPDFFIVGHAKSGTTALYEMLRRHPQIYMPDAKEPWFLATDMGARFQPRRAGNPPHTLEQYLSLFAAATPAQRVGEASSSYLWSHTAARRIAQLQPAARIIAILREPASFLHSLHLQLLQTHVEVKRDLRTALALEDARRQGRRIPRRSHRPQLLLYSEHVRYTEQLRRYHAEFAPEQVLVLIYDDFRADNAATVRGVLRFLDVDESAELGAVEANAAVRVRSPRLRRAARPLHGGEGTLARALSAAARLATPGGRGRARLRALRHRLTYGAPAAADERVMADLRRRFRGEVEALSEYLGRDLVSLWGYDRAE